MNSQLPKQRLHDSSRNVQAERVLKYWLPRVAEKVSRQGGIAGHVALPNGCIQSCAVQPWHLKVGEDGIAMMLVKPGECLKTVAGGIDLVALMRDVSDGGHSGEFVETIPLGEKHVEGLIGRMITQAASNSR